MLTPSRAARVGLIGMSCNSSGPVPSLADILEPGFVISTIVIDSSRYGVDLGLRDLGTAREQPSTREPWVSYSSHVVALQHRNNMLHWHLRVKPDLALQKRPQAEAEAGAGRTVGGKQCGAMGWPSRSVSSMGFFRRYAMTTETAASAVRVVTALRRAFAE
jgi:hypothetical protein